MRQVVGLLTIVFLGIVVIAYAAPITMPNIFSSGTTISSGQVNANFTELTNAVNALRTGYVSAAAVNGVPRDSAYATTQSATSCIGRRGVTAGLEYLVVPIQIPNGATITEFTYIAHDNEGGNDSTAFLYTSANETIASVITGGASAVAQTVTQTGLTTVVDNATKGYFVYMEINGSNPAMYPCAAIVRYTY